MDKIKKLEIENFTCFNVLIGQNGTGKTHVLKLLYSFLRTARSHHKDYPNIDEYAFGGISLNNLADIFKSSDNLNELIKKDSKLLAGKKYFKIDYSTDIHNVQVRLNDVFKISIVPSSLKFNISVVYLPPQEILAISSSLRFFYEKYHSNYDATYFDLAKALDTPKLKNIGDFQDIVNELLQEIGGQIQKKDKKFSINFDGKEINAPLLAEGIKKIATVQYLIENGSITKDTILLWDEPEVHFNPQMIPFLVKLMEKMANAGMQIFIATHDYLLSQQLSLRHEYKTTLEPKEKIPDMKFFGLYEDKNQKEVGILVEEGQDLVGISNNPILEQFINHHNLEHQYFNQKLQNS